MTVLLRSASALFIALVALAEQFGCAPRANPAADSPAFAPRRAGVTPSVLTPLLPGAIVASATDGLARSRAPNGAPSGVVEELAVVRRPLEERPARAALPDDVARLLAEAADHLTRGDLQRARAAAAQARAFAPSTPETIELGLLVELASSDAERVREALATLSSVDPSNPIVVAFDGLDALERGDDVAALASLAWFVGDGALRRRGAAIPLPTAGAELEEQAAACALRLGRPTLALVAIESAAAVHVDDQESRRMLALLESDALLALGRLEESRAALDAWFGPSSSSDPLARLAVLRQDRIDLARGAPDRAAAAALGAFHLQPLDDFRLWRVATLLRLDASRAGIISDRGVDRAGRSGRELARLDLVEALAAGSARSSLVARALPRLEEDHAAFTIGLAALQFDSPSSAVEATVAAVERVPERADLMAMALLASGLELDEIEEGLALAGRGAAADAVRSRVFARIGLPEDAYRIAELACSRDRASAAALSAAALAAAELGDETLLDEIDAAAVAGDVRVGESLDRAWRLLGRPDRAEDRRARLGSRPATDSHGRSIVASTFEASSVEPLLATARALDARRIPLAFEAIALAEALDPGRSSALVLLEPLRARAAPGAMASYARAAAAEAPALVARRRLALGLADPGVSEAGRSAAGALSARVDETILATGPARAGLERSRAESRPRTSEAIAALASVEARADRCESARALLETAAMRQPPATSALGARAVFRAAVEAGVREPAASPRMWRVAARVLPFADDLDAGDVGRVALLWSASGEDLEALRSAVSMLVERLRLDEVDLGRVRGTLGALREAAGDPLPAAELAAALSGETSLPVVLRSALGATAIALFAESGASADSSRDLVLRLAETGATPLRRSPEEVLGPADALVRAASVHDLLSDAAGNRALLRAALELDPELGDAMNNLAYLDVEEGDVGEVTARLAERAAEQAPDDPAVLDTLACVRAELGHLRDDVRGPGAITLFRQALRLRPEDPSLSTLDRLGDALWRDGDGQGAIRCWQQVGQVAALRYPPEPIARSLLEYQQREIGLQLVDPIDYVRRRYGSVVDRAEAKLRQVAAGEPPTLGSRATRDD